MSLTDEMARDLAEMINDFPASICMAQSGTPIPATVSPLTRENQTETNGVFQNYDAQVVASLSGFASIPEPNDACWVTDTATGMNNTRCIIKSVMRDGAALTFTVKRGRT